MRGISNIFVKQMKKMLKKSYMMLTFRGNFVIKWTYRRQRQTVVKIMH